MTMKIVSLQDVSCYGQCSLTVALPVLSALGHETAILPSAILSTHTSGFKGFTCLDLTAELAKILDHWARAGIRFDAVYTGYIGDARQFDIVRRLKHEFLASGGKLIVDPAMADDGKLYPALRPETVAGMRGIVAEADTILPNLTEAALLLGRPYNPSPDRVEVESLLRGLAALGPELSVLTSVPEAHGRVGAVAYGRTADVFTDVFAERIPGHFHGTGDIFSSVFIGDWIRGKGVRASLRDAVDFVVAAIQNTRDDPSHAYGVKYEPLLARFFGCRA